jgi:hypothetical protein
MLRDLLAQPVVTIVVIPVGLAVVSLIFEWGVRRTKGKPISVTKNMRFWVQETELDDNGNETFIYRPLVDDLDTLASLHLDYSTRQDPNEKKIIAVEPLGFGTENYASVGMDLALGAFAITLAALIEREGDPRFIGIAEFVLLLMFAGVFFSLVVQHGSEPNAKVTKVLSALSAVVFGLVAMMIAFAALNEAVVAGRP